MTMHRQENLVDVIIQKWANLKNPALEWLMSKEYEIESKNLDYLLYEYAENVPKLRLAKCPFCDRPAQITMDSSRLDGPWWTHSYLFYPDDDVCEHFVLLSGAMKLVDRLENFPKVADIHPGPSSPFVIPRLLQAEGTIAVINQVPLAKVHTAFPILYFSETLSRKDVKHPSWGKEEYPVYDDAGEYAFSWVATDHWSFNLTAWLKREKLWWVEPGDSSVNLSKGTPSPYDHFSQPGVNQRIRGGELQEIPLPEDLGELDPWTSHAHDD